MDEGNSCGRSARNAKPVVANAPSGSYLDGMSTNEGRDADAVTHEREEKAVSGPDTEAHTDRPKSAKEKKTKKKKKERRELLGEEQDGGTARLPKTGRRDGAIAGDVPAARAADREAPSQLAQQCSNSEVLPHLQYGAVHPGQEQGAHRPPGEDDESCQQAKTYFHAAVSGEKPVEISAGCSVHHLSVEKVLDGGGLGITQPPAQPDLGIEQRKKEEKRRKKERAREEGEKGKKHGSKKRRKEADGDGGAEETVSVFASSARRGEAETLDRNAALLATTQTDPGHGDEAMPEPATQAINALDGKKDAKREKVEGEEREGGKKRRSKKERRRAEMSGAAVEVAGQGTAAVDEMQGHTVQGNLDCGGSSDIALDGQQAHELATASSTSGLGEICEATVASSKLSSAHGESGQIGMDNASATAAAWAKALRPKAAPAPRIPVDHSSKQNKKEEKKRKRQERVDKEQLKEVGGILPVLVDQSQCHGAQICDTAISREIDTEGSNRHSSKEKKQKNKQERKTEPYVDQKDRSKREVTHGDGGAHDKEVLLQKSGICDIDSSVLPADGQTDDISQGMVNNVSEFPSSSIKVAAQDKALPKVEAVSAVYEGFSLRPKAAAGPKIKTESEIGQKDKKRKKERKKEKKRKKEAAAEEGTRVGDEERPREGRTAVEGEQAGQPIPANVLGVAAVRKELAIHECEEVATSSVGMEQNAKLSAASVFEAAVSVADAGSSVTLVAEHAPGLSVKAVAGAAPEIETVEAEAEVGRQVNDVGGAPDSALRKAEQASDAAIDSKKVAVLDRDKVAHLPVRIDDDSNLSATSVFEAGGPRSEASNVDEIAAMLVVAKQSTDLGVKPMPRQTPDPMNREAEAEAARRLIEAEPTVGRALGSDGGASAAGTNLEMTAVRGREEFARHLVRTDSNAHVSTTSVFEAAACRTKTSSARVTKSAQVSSEEAQDLGVKSIAGLAPEPMNKEADAELARQANEAGDAQKRVPGKDERAYGATDDPELGAVRHHEQSREWLPCTSEASARLVNSVFESGTCRDGAVKVEASSTEHAVAGRTSPKPVSARGPDQAQRHGKKAKKHKKERRAEREDCKQENTPDRKTLGSGAEEADLLLGSFLQTVVAKSEPPQPTTASVVHASAGEGAVTQGEELVGCPAGHALESAVMVATRKPSDAGAIEVINVDVDDASDNLAPVTNESIVTGSNEMTGSRNGPALEPQGALAQLRSADDSTDRAKDGPQERSTSDPAVEKSVRNCHVVERWPDLRDNEIDALRQMRHDLRAIANDAPLETSAVSHTRGAIHGNDNCASALLFTVASDSRQQQEVIASNHLVGNVSVGASSAMDASQQACGSSAPPIEDRAQKIADATTQRSIACPADTARESDAADLCSAAPSSCATRHVDRSTPQTTDGMANCKFLVPGSLVMGSAIFGVPFTGSEASSSPLSSSPVSPYGDADIDATTSAVNVVADGAVLGGMEKASGDPTDSVVHVVKQDTLLASTSGVEDCTLTEGVVPVMENDVFDITGKVCTPDGAPSADHELGPEARIAQPNDVDRLVDPAITDARNGEAKTRVGASAEPEAETEVTEPPQRSTAQGIAVSKLGPRKSGSSDVSSSDTTGSSSSTSSPRARSNAVAVGRSVASGRSKAVPAQPRRRLPSDSSDSDTSRTTEPTANTGVTKALVKTIASAVAKAIGPGPIQSTALRVVSSSSDSSDSDSSLQDRLCAKVGTPATMPTPSPPPVAIAAPLATGSRSSVHAAAPPQLTTGRRACAKMLVRVGLRCGCHFVYLSDCPSNRSSAAALGRRQNEGDVDG